jgi:DNA mismatch repair protein MutS
MAGVPSILFRRPMHAVEELTAPECFPDLHLDRIVDAIVPGNSDHPLERFFYAPRYDVAEVNFRHEVFRDLERDENRQPIQAFVDGMRTVRDLLQTASKIWHPLQKQGWFVHAVHAYCNALVSLDTDLTGLDVSSHGLRDIADYVADYVDGDGFRRLVDETDTVRAELGKIRYTVHIEGLRVHVDNYDGQTDYSADVAAVFERFRRDAAGTTASSRSTTRR